MRIQGFDYQYKNEWWILRTKIVLRFASWLMGALFILLGLYLMTQDHLALFAGCALFGALLIGSSYFCEEILLSKNEIRYHRQFPFRTFKKFPADTLISVTYGRVDLLIGRSRVPGYRVWLDFKDNTVPRSVIFEKTLQWNADAPQKAEELAKELSSTLGILLQKQT